MTPKKSPKHDSFATQFVELEKIVQAFEEEGMSIDRGMELFEKGLVLAEKLKKNLIEVENTIVTLKKRYDVDDASENEDN